MAKTNKNVNNQKQRKGLRVIGNPLINKFIASSPPAHFRSNHYSIQTALGITGILLIFMSFKIPAFFFIGAILLYVRRQWRLKTDNYAIIYRDAINSLKKKKYRGCVQNLNKIPCEDHSMSYLDLVKASCMLELEDTESAYSLYKSYFSKTPSSYWADSLYWSARENAVILSLEHNNHELAKKILNNPSEHLEENKDTIPWKAKYMKFVNEA